MKNGAAHKFVSGLIGTPQPQHSRYDCPQCDGDKTLSVSCTVDGSLVYHCYKASCGARGYAGTTDAIAKVMNMFGRRLDDILEDKVPEYFVSVSMNEAAMRYLHDNHCYDAYSDGRAIIKYDVAESRVVFIDGNRAVGRALRKGTKPKWKSYTRTPRPYICKHELYKHTSGLILVEDCASACAASSVMDTMALCGTDFHSSYYEFLNLYDVVYVCLDQDATNKAIKLADKISCTKPAYVRMLYNDLKMLTAEEIRAVI